VPPLGGETLFEARADAVVDRLAVGPDRLLRERRDGLGHLDVCGQRLARFDQPVDEPPLAGGLGVEFLAGEDEFQRPTEADDPREALGAAVDERDAEPPLEAAEGRRLAGDPQVAPRAISRPPATQ
jgi:hypothetical protein